MSKSIRRTETSTMPPPTSLATATADECGGPRVSTSNLVFIILTFLVLLVIIVYVFESQVQHLKKDIEEVEMLQARQLNATEIMELIHIQQQQQSSSYHRQVNESVASSPVQ